MWRQVVQNREGTPVDPVPAFVVTLTGFLITYAWGPLYLITLGFSLAQSLAILTLLFLAIAGATYHQMIWEAYPERRDEVPSSYRVHRFRYAVLIGVALIVLLALPLVRVPG